MSARPQGVFRQWDRFLVEYEAGGVLHERLVYLHCSGKLYVILTPHRDLYVEDFTGYLRMWKLGSCRGLVGVDRHQLADRQLLRLPWVEIEVYVGEIASEARDVCAEYLNAHQLLPAPPADPPPPQPDAQPRLPAAAVTPITDEFIATGNRGGIRIGQPVSYTIDTLTRKVDRGIVEYQSGCFIAVALVNSFTTPELEDDEDDIRTLPISYDAASVRTRPFDDAARFLTQNDMADWKVSGPRTTRWLCNVFVEQSTTPGRRHQWWTHCLGLGPNDEGVDEHSLFGEVLEVALQQDQYNVSEAACFELIARRYQMWEQFYGPKLRDRTDASGSNIDRDERSLYLGQTRTTNSTVVAPDLEEWVSSQHKENATILKERRKVREDNDSADPGGKGRRRRGMHGKADAVAKGDTPAV